MLIQTNEERRNFLKKRITGNIISLYWIENKIKKNLRGLIINSKKGDGHDNGMITVITVSSDNKIPLNKGALEVIFPLFSPFVEKIQVVGRIATRRKRLFFYRQGKKRNLKLLIT